MEALETMVKAFQDNRDKEVLNLMFSLYLPKIQAKAYAASVSFNLDNAGCEERLIDMFGECVEKWEREMGVPFEKYLAKWLRIAVTRQKQDEDIERKKYNYVYDLTPEGWESIVDTRINIENFICEQESCNALVEDLKEYDQTAALVAVLKASSGKRNYEIAKAVGYRPDVSNQRNAQEKWVEWRLNKLQEPVRKFYKRLGMLIPIKLRY